MDVLFQGGEKMKFKKCGFLLSLVMLICFAIPSFASAEVETDVLLGKKPYLDFDFTKVATDSDSMNITDVDKMSDYDLRSGTFYYDLGRNYSISKVLLEARTSTGNFNALVLNLYDANKNRIYSSGQKEFIFPYNGYNNAPFVPMEKKYEYNNVRYVSVGGSVRVRYVKLFGESYIPSISNVNSVAGINDVSFTWENPSNPLFTGVKIYKEGSLVATVNKDENSYKVDGLEANKNYNFKFVAMYGESDSKGIEKVVKTKLKPKEPMPLIKPPESVILTPQNGKMVIAWNDVKSPYLEGYNVYIDGKKVNDEPLKSNKLIVKSLENGKPYKVQISAVNKENAEGEKSKAKEDKPSVDALEVEYDVKMPFDPKDVLGVAMVFLLIVGPLILLGLVLKFYKPFITFLYNSIQNKKGRDEK